jgi:hypothetical protein
MIGTLCCEQDVCTYHNSTPTDTFWGTVEDDYSGVNCYMRLRIGISNALFKPRADTGQPVMSTASRVPRTSRKAMGTRRRGCPKRPFFPDKLFYFNMLSDEDRGETDKGARQS